MSRPPGGPLRASHWAIAKLDIEGAVRRADEVVERSHYLCQASINRTACGSPGLFTEEFDGQRQLRGNLPPAFVHALMFETAHRLAGACGPPVGAGTGPRC